MVFYKDYCVTQNSKKPKIDTLVNQSFSKFD